MPNRGVARSDHAGSRTTKCTVAIVHDYLTQRGGAERVVLSMLKAFPGAPVYTALYEPDSTFPEFKDEDVRPLWTNRIAALRRNHRRGLLLYPLAFSSLKIDADVVICSSSGFAHGARTTGHKVVYCHTPARWLYDQAGTYLAGWPPAVARLVRAAGPVLRRWDKHAASTADRYLTNSNAVRDRIRDVYGIEAEVAAPPAPSTVNGEQRAVPGVEPGFVLCVSRLLSYKNVGAVVSAFDRLPDARLVVVGEGPEKSRLTDAAGSNVAVLGRVDDWQLAWLYANCAGVVCASYEDFGLTAIEAASCGKPVAALRAGGFLDTVVEGENGIFFDWPVSHEVASAINAVLTSDWDADAMIQGARRTRSFALALERTTDTWLVSDDEIYVGR
ncbi:MAG: glycosyltransferase [Actinobacteria bacterium]|nr:glycosyltransferase [Actinomycetota bacterium]